MRLRTVAILAAVVLGTAAAVSPALASTCPWLPTWGGDKYGKTTTTEPETVRNCDVVVNPDADEEYFPECDDVTPAPSTSTTTTTTATTTTTTTSTTTTTPTTTTAPGTTTTLPAATTQPATTTTAPPAAGPGAGAGPTTTTTVAVPVLPPVTTTTTSPRPTTTTKRPAAKPKPDVCPNLRGRQVKVPKGKIKRNGRCVAKKVVRPKRKAGKANAKGAAVCIVNGRPVRPCVRGKG